MLGIFDDVLPECVAKFFSESRADNEVLNTITEQQSTDIVNDFSARVNELAAFNTQQEMNEAVSQLLRTVLQQQHIENVDALITSFIASMSQEPWPEIFDKYRHLRIEAALLRNAEENAPESILPAKDDLDVIFMARLFTRMPLFPDDYQKYSRYEVCNAYDAQHMVWWFSGQITLGSGAYRRSKPNFSAKKTWNGLRNPYSLLWIAIALGVEDAVVAAAFSAMKTNGNLASQCSAIRKHISFDAIHNRALSYLPNRSHVAAQSHVFEQVKYIGNKLDADQVASLTGDCEKELLRTPVFDAKNKDEIEAWFYPVAEYLLLRHGFTEEELDKVVPDVGEALYQLA